MMEFQEMKGAFVPSSNVPGFLSKLWLLVEDKATDELIKWGPLENSFIVQNQTRFAKEILPKFFKHSNMASFIRQLNMYGFRKKTNLEQGSLKTESDDIEFQHANFLRGRPKLLENIKRKVSARDESKLKLDDVHQILTDVQDMKGKQDNISGTLESIQRENQVLWREVVYLRQRHEKQQKIVNRLIQFLLTMVKPVGIKRKQQLMIEPASDVSKPKYSRVAGSGDSVQIIEPVLCDTELNNLPATSSLSSGAVVSDITDAQIQEPQAFAPPQDEPGTASVSQPSSATLDPSLFELDIPPMPSDAAKPVPSPIISSPASMEPSGTNLSPIGETSADLGSPVWSLPETESQPNADIASFLSKADDNQIGSGAGSDFWPPVGQATVETPETTSGAGSRAVMKRMLSHDEQRDELGEHVTTVQDNLDMIQHMLTSLGSSGVYNLDMDSLLNIFNSDTGGSTHDTDLYPILADGNSQNPNSQNPNNEDGITDTAVVQYVPSPTCAFTVDDEDSLLRSLNDDSEALERFKSSVD